MSVRISTRSELPASATLRLMLLTSTRSLTLSWLAERLELRGCLA